MKRLYILPKLQVTHIEGLTLMQAVSYGEDNTMYYHPNPTNEQW